VRIGVASVSDLTTIGWSPMREMIPGRAAPVGDVVGRTLGELVMAAAVGLGEIVEGGEVVVGAAQDPAIRPHRTSARRWTLRSCSAVSCAGRTREV
jgi:hypothetical protein